MAKQTELSFQASTSAGTVAALLDVPPDAWALLVFAHGAGAGMEHRFMSGMSTRLAERGIGTFRYQFPYVEAGKKRPDPQPVLLATVRSAVRRAGEEGLPLLAGGKSMGGRMTSLAASAEPLADVRGIVFFGFPLHAPGKPGTERAAHLSDVTVPLLFLQGTRDTLAKLELMEPVIENLGNAATLHVADGADHGFHVQKRSGRTDADVMDELADAVVVWARTASLA
jgi:predicted alpha/beta-hydrolase family hydrolase